MPSVFPQIMVVWLTGPSRSRKKVVMKSVTAGTQYLPETVLGMGQRIH